MKQTLKTKQAKKALKTRARASITQTSKLYEINI